jgi:tRNA nucleotidyltransferase/poly(A) polymerase
MHQEEILPINSIYADIDGNLFDPFDGKKDLRKWKNKFYW